MKFNTVMQSGLVISTLTGVLLVSLKLPQYGLICSLVSQIFWFYSSYKAWRYAKQYGILINTIFMTLIVLFGIINYWR